MMLESIPLKWAQLLHARGGKKYLSRTFRCTKQRKLQQDNSHRSHDYCRFAPPPPPPHHLAARLANPQLGTMPLTTTALTTALSVAQASTAEKERLAPTAAPASTARQARLRVLTAAPGSASSKVGLEASPLSAQTAPLGSSPPQEPPSAPRATQGSTGEDKIFHDGTKHNF